MTSRTYEKLSDPGYRSAFVASQISVGIPFQLRGLLKARGKTQEWLAQEAGMRQPRISHLLTPGKASPNIETLRRLAEAFDCGLAVRFVPFSELAEWSERFDPETFSVPAFEGDRGFFEDSELEAPLVESLSSGIAHASTKVLEGFAGQSLRAPAWISGLSLKQLMGLRKGQDVSSQMDAGLSESAAAAGLFGQMKSLSSEVGGATQAAGPQAGFGGIVQIDSSPHFGRKDPSRVLKSRIGRTRMARHG